MNLKNIGDKINALWKLNKDTSDKQQQQLDELIGVLKEKELLVEAPIVNTEKTDLEPIVQAIKEIPTIDIDRLEKALKTLDMKPTEQKAPVVNVESQDLTPIIKAIKAIDVKPKVIVEKEETVVNVEKQTSTNPKEYVPSRITDGKKFIDLEKWLREIVQTTAKAGGGSSEVKLKTSDGTLVSGSNPLPITGSITASASTLADYSVNDIDDTTSTEYYGFTKPDATWLVKKVVSSGVSYATVTNNGGTTSYATAWTNRAALTYGRFDEAF